MRPFVRTWKAWQDSQAALRVYASVDDLPPVILIGFTIHEVQAEGIVFRGVGNHAMYWLTYTELDLIEPIGENEDGL